MIYNPIPFEDATTAKKTYTQHAEGGNPKFHNQRVILMVKVVWLIQIIHQSEEITEFITIC